jgi:hypothetical protein
MPKPAWITDPSNPNNLAVMREESERVQPFIIEDHNNFVKQVLKEAQEGTLYWDVAKTKLTKSEQALTNQLIVDRDIITEYRNSIPSKNTVPLQQPDTNFVLIAGGIAALYFLFR